MTAKSASANAVDRDVWERDRLAALQRFDVLDSPREEPFDRITRLIRAIFGVDVGIVSMIDGHRQWYKAVDGLPTTEVARHETFCRFTLEAGETIVIPDATADARVSANPHVTADRGVRFYASVPLRTADGQIIGTICAIDYAPREFTHREIEILEDLALITMNELELRQRATIDVLTGVLSRRAFKEEGARATSLAARHQHPLACIVLDMDHFKSVNDTFGHAAGDKVLIDVTKSCVGLLRQSDLIGRLGGEEFALLLPHTDLDGAMEVAEKLRSAVEHLAFAFDGQPVSVTASFGVSSIDSGSPDIETLIEQADAALYEAKAAGRNRCVASGRSAIDPGPGKEPLPLPRRVLKAGSVIFNKQASVIDCTVRTMSDRGAGIDLSTTFGVPKKFVLAIRSDGFESQCTVISQTERHLEVEFC